MAIIKKKVMGKSMKKADNGTAVKPKKKPTTSGIISESGDLADALNEYEAMKRKGTVPKTSAGANAQMNKWNAQGKLGTPKKKMGGKIVKKKK